MSSIDTGVTGPPATLDRVSLLLGRKLVRMEDLSREEMVDLIRRTISICVGNFRFTYHDLFKNHEMWRKVRNGTDRPISGNTRIISLLNEETSCFCSEIILTEKGHLYLLTTLSGASVATFTLLEDAALLKIQRPSDKLDWNLYWLQTIWGELRLVIKNASLQAHHANLEFQKVLGVA